MASAADRYARREAASNAAWAAGDVRIDVSELNQLAVVLDRESGAVGARAAAVVRKAASDVESTAKSFAVVDTGFLKNSISWSLTNDGRHMMVEAEIGPTAAYGSYLETGTSTMAPRAFMGPALDRHSGAFAAALAQITAQDL